MSDYNSTPDPEFQSNLDDIREFVKYNGNVPRLDATNTIEAKLAEWLSQRIQDRRAGRIEAGDARDVALIEMLGAAWWDEAERAYQQNLAGLHAFVVEHGEPPRNYGPRAGETELSAWVSARAAERKAGRIEPGDARDTDLTRELGDNWQNRSN